MGRAGAVCLLCKSVCVMESMYEKKWLNNSELIIADLKNINFATRHSKPGMSYRAMFTLLDEDLRYIVS